jgi:hypothetical protein
MSGPDGAELVFVSHNEQGFSQFKKIVTRKSDGKQVAKGAFEAGTCTAMSLLFLSRMMNNGSVTADDVGANLPMRMVKGGTATFSKAAHMAAISQGAREMGHGAKMSEKQRDAAQIEAFGLKVVSKDAFPLQVGPLQTKLQKLVFEPGYYKFDVSSHSMAIVIDRGSTAWFFDPDEGLFKWSPPRGFGPSLAAYIVEDYEDDLGDDVEFFKVEARY